MDFYETNIFPFKEKLINMRAHGAPIEFLAAYCGIGYASFLRALDEHPEFALKMKRAY